MSEWLPKQWRWPWTSGETLLLSPHSPSWTALRLQWSHLDSWSPQSPRTWSGTITLSPLWKRPNSGCTSFASWGSSTYHRSCWNSSSPPPLNPSTALLVHYALYKCNKLLLFIIYCVLCYFVHCLFCILLLFLLSVSCLVVVILLHCGASITKTNSLYV